MWVLFEAGDVPDDGLAYATPDELQRQVELTSGIPRPLPAHWISVEVAAHVLAEESADALRKKLVRAAVRGSDGTYTANVNGVHGRKLGKLWKVRLSAEWLATPSGTKKTRG